ncbi:MAG TPA: nidogen-like domain-containing protein [Gemmatirosa sp.]|nr:nidogen-like domain-containing protein [Gemmatirosa sp.]
MQHLLQRSLVVAGLVLATAVLPGTVDAQVRRDAAVAGFNANTLPRNDDQSTGLVNIGFSAAVNFFGTSATQLYVNNNGNVTFTSALSQFTPSALTGATSNPIIAAFFADVDTRNPASAETRYGSGTVNGRAAFGVNWDGVGYFASRADKLNIFQLILVERFDTGAGNFDIEFNYDQIQWETGEASNGVNGLGGISAAVGYSAGSGASGTFAQEAGSFVNGALLDNGPNSLRARQRILYQVRAGQVVTPPVSTIPEPTTVALLGTGILMLAGIANHRRRQG